MKSDKQKRAEINAKQKRKAAKRQPVNKATDRRLRPVLGPPVNEALLAPNNSYGAPDFVYRGCYVDRHFVVSTAASKRCGPVRSRSGGMKWPKGSLIQPRVAVGCAGAKNDNETGKCSAKTTQPRRLSHRCISSPKGRVTPQTRTHSNPARLIVKPEYLRFRRISIPICIG